MKASAVIHLDESHIHILALNMEDPRNEQTIEAARPEIAETTTGMTTFLNEIESDQIDLIALASSSQRLHKVFIRLFMTHPEQQSPFQKLLGHSTLNNILKID